MLYETNSKGRYSRAYTSGTHLKLKYNKSSFIL